MGPLSYLHSGLPKISGVWILPYCIGDREATENAEWDTLQFVKVGDPTKGLTTTYAIHLLIELGWAFIADRSVVDTGLSW